MGVDSAYNIWDLRRRAKRRLPRSVFEFMDRGSEDDNNLRLNRDALDRIKLVPRILRDVSERDTSIELFGRSRPLPFLIGPTGIADLMWFRGELALARAAAAAGIPFTLATSSTTSIDDIGRTATAGFWLQMYMWENREMSLQVADRAAAAGAEALILTVDTPILPNREFNQQNGMSNPIRPSLTLAKDFALHPRWTAAVLARYLTSGGMPRFVNYPAAIGGSVTGPIHRMTNASSVTWADVDSLRRRWPGKLLIKGILNPDDAAEAAERGADGVIVSNHGGRNFDCAPAAIDVLPEVVDRVGDRMTVLFDSGVRRGTDILKALALGANAVLLGRATLYGVASGGEQGAGRAIALLQREVSMAMAMLGLTSLDQLDRSTLRRDGAAFPPARPRAAPVVHELRETWSAG